MNFVGIDFSKQTFDAAIRVEKGTFPTKTFKNNKEGFQNFQTWGAKILKTDPKEWIICGEKTGIYSDPFLRFAKENGLFCWLENPIQIKRAQGMVRGKNDTIDAARIATYAYRFQDKAERTKPRAEILEEIHMLSIQRKRLIKKKNELTVPLKELAQTMEAGNRTLLFMEEQVQKVVDTIQEAIEAVEKKIPELRKEVEEIAKNYDLMLSVPGIGPVNATEILVVTENFTRINDPRKFACYSGVVPFEHSSGTSVYRKEHISSLANRDLKALLTCAANSAVRYDPIQRAYYERKKEEGKPHRLIINNVRNRLIKLVFAVVRTGCPYDPNYVSQFGCTA